MSVHMHACVYCTCVGVHVRTCTCASVCMCTCMCTCVHMSVHMHECVCMFCVYFLLPLLPFSTTIPVEPEASLVAELSVFQSYGQIRPGTGGKREAAGGCLNRTGGVERAEPLKQAGEEGSSSGKTKK